MDSIKCVTVGDGTVGKTCLLVSYTTNSFPGDYVPTIFDNHSTNIMVDKNVVNLGLWDTAGQDDYDRLRPLAYPQTDAFILVYSVDSKTSLDNVIKKWNPEVREHVEKAKVVLVGNKCDLRENKAYAARMKCKGKAFVSKQEGQEAAKHIGADAFFECSALSQEGINELFEESVRLVLNQRQKDMKRRRKAKCTII